MAEPNFRTSFTERSAEPVRSISAERSAEPFWFGRTLLINESFQRFSEMHTLGHENVGRAPKPSVLNLLFYRGATLKPNCKS